MSDLIELVGEALQKECLEIFGSTWNNDNTRRLSRAAIKALGESFAESQNSSFGFVGDELLEELRERS